MACKNFSNTVDMVKLGIDDLKEKVDDLIEIVGDEDSGLVKDVADLKTVVGDEDSGLVKDVADLKTVVGDEDSGLVKDVADIETKVDTMHKFYKATYEASESPITITIDISDINIGVDTVLDIYPNIGVTVTSYSVSGTTLTIVIPAQASAGTIIAMFTNTVPVTP